MKIEARTFIEAPPSVVFRFFTELDHLRWVSAQRRREWCSSRGLRLRAGANYEIQVRQGRHAIGLEFKTTRYEVERLVEDECHTFPVKGAVRLLTCEPDQGGTLVADMNYWDPPWYARAIVAKNEDEQRSFFAEKLANAKRVVEQVFRAHGEQAFTRGVAAELEALGILPVIKSDER